ncbi:exported repetitive domain protein [Mycobacterium kansasii 824]|nr:exported repetitive domain protein [Mycobacterium kansasii 824]OOK76044.1 exported repetitive domain protein [Mycobacterium kansasii]
MQAANQLGAGQAIDLLKGVLMPSIMQAIQNGGAAAPAAGAPAAGLPAAVPPAVPAAAAPVVAPPAAPTTPIA